MELGLYSIIGKMRKIDEDSVVAFCYEGRPEGIVMDACLCALADGMGGGSKGDVASKLALRAFWESTKQLVLDNISDAQKIKKVLVNGVEQANLTINDYRRKNRIDDMGTTVVATYLCGESLFVVNVGDSRTYVITEGRVQKKTKDHSHVQELVDAGRLTPDQVRIHPRRNEITRVLGMDKSIEVDFYEWRVFEGDSILLCCDGLWEALGDDLLAQFASKKVPAVELVKEMVEKANELDGSDNISAILFRPSLHVEAVSLLERETESRHRKQGDRSSSKG